MRRLAARVAARAATWRRAALYVAGSTGSACAAVIKFLSDEALNRAVIGEVALLVVPRAAPRAQRR